MTTENYKTFTTKAITGKGTFEVRISIWEEISDGKNYFVTRSWESKTTVLIDNKELPAKFNRYATQKITSWDISRYFGLDKEATLRCDTSEAVKYIRRIESEKRKKMVTHLEDSATSDMLNDL